MFGYTFIKKEDLDRLYKMSSKYQQLATYHYWFSGFEPLYSLLEKFVMNKVNQSNIWDVRDAYAKAMNADRYGRHLEEIELKAVKEENKRLKDEITKLRFKIIELDATVSRLSGAPTDIVGTISCTLKDGSIESFKAVKPKKKKKK